MHDNTPSANLVLEYNMNLLQRREASAQYEAKVKFVGVLAEQGWRPVGGRLHLGGWWRLPPPLGRVRLYGLFHKQGGRSQGDGVRRAVGSSARYVWARHAFRALALPAGLPSCT
eukprot:5113663-Pleurochrysis_carterae.AAC.1